jgi:NAD(P)H dehydrogenase (quinone)
MKILVLYYSMYGNNFYMAKAVAEGVKEAGGEPIVRTVSELIPTEVIEKDDRLKKAKELQRNIPFATIDDLPNCDGSSWDRQHALEICVPRCGTSGIGRPRSG